MDGWKKGYFLTCAMVAALGCSLSICGGTLAAIEADSPMPVLSAPIGL